MGIDRADVGKVLVTVSVPALVGLVGFAVEHDVPAVAFYAAGIVLLIGLWLMFDLWPFRSPDPDHDDVLVQLAVEADTLADEMDAFDSMPHADRIQTVDGPRYEYPAELQAHRDEKFAARLNRVKNLAHKEGVDGSLREIATAARARFSKPKPQS